MKRDTVNYVMVGAFVVAMGIAFIVFLFAVTGRSGPTDPYYVHYDNVAGLKFGTGVFYEGYRVGQIETITPEPGDSGMRYLLELSVASGWRIPDDSVARVQSSGLISAITIEISEGESQTFHAPGAFITGIEKSDLMSVLNDAAADFRTLSRDGVMPVLKNVNQRVTQLTEEILRFRRDDLSPFVKMLHERVESDVLNEVAELLNHLDDSANGLKNILGEENQEQVHDFLVHVDEVAVNLNALINRIETTRLQMNGVLASIGELVTENQNGIARTVDSAEVSMDELELALKTLNARLGTILYNIEGSSRHMNEFARTIRENPSRLLRNTATGEPTPQ